MTTPTATLAPATEADLNVQIYRLLDGGAKSDRLLHRRVLELIAPFLPGKRVLDIGVGDGRLTERYLAHRPASVTVSDFEQSSIDRTMRRLEGKAAEVGTALYEQQLDVRDLTPLEGQRFDVIVIASVLMHVDGPDSEKAIAEFTKYLAPGGVMLVAVICSDLARSTFIPSEEEGWYYPRVRGLPHGTTESQLLAKYPTASVLREFYPLNGHYKHACADTGLRVEEEAAIIGDECAGCFYGEHTGKTLWKLFMLHN